ncbi:hypothetical protein BT67DRAFT_113996 [Trichocladium antarcticum]|uniref:Uncharacterized protein n=1 Tax=Trichocladium antarcticum TaxID=1450529 RepID=A0AAN6ZFT8_9PEZI|nr:hypothetical protein BT67DRAFT_113996 [Trichocladium antarcticum]
MTLANTSWTMSWKPHSAHLKSCLSYYFQIFQWISVRPARAGCDAPQRYMRRLGNCFTLNQSSSGQCCLCHQRAIRRSQASNSPARPTRSTTSLVSSKSPSQADGRVEGVGVDGVVAVEEPAFADRLCEGVGRGREDDEPEGLVMDWRVGSW